MSEDIQLLPESWEVKVNGNTVKFTPNEFRLFDLLLSSRGQVIKRALIDEFLWLESGAKSNSIEVLIYNIRRKLKRVGWAGVETIPLSGYRIK